jgi:hypothetical protein
VTLSVDIGDSDNNRVPSPNDSEGNHPPPNLSNAMKDFHPFLYGE